MIVIGIVGSPAGGKSTVARHLRELGATWINADRMAHRVLRSRTVASRLSTFFGAGVLDSHGGVDRAALSGLVFGDDAESRRGLDYLESVIHPLARHRVLLRLMRSSRCRLPAAVLDAPLLLEADWGILCDVVWCVDAPEELRRDWIVRRGWSIEELRKRESRQLPIAEKRRLSNHVLENNSNCQALLDQTEYLWRQLMDRVQQAYFGGIIFDPSHCLHYSSPDPT